MKTMKNLFISLPRIIITIAFPLVFFLLSCEKQSDNDLPTGPATLAVELVGVMSENEDLSTSKTASTNAQITTLTPEVLEIPINKDLSAYITLQEDEESKSAKTNTNPINKTAATELAPVTLNVKYGILVYDGDNLIPNGHKIFTAGSESTAEAFALNGGKTYTFIGYSRNSEIIPTVSNMSKLSTAQINDENGDLLYFKHVQTVQTGDNNLKVTLRHKFTLITTKLKVGATYAGKIQQVQSGLFAKVRDKASIKLSDGSITYSATEVSSSVSFPSIPSGGVASIKSTPNLLIANNSTNVVTYNFPSIKVNDITGTIPATTLNMQAGKKYNLILTLDVPCISNAPIPFNVNDGNSATFNLNGKEGITIDFDKIDDSFNLKINGTNLFEAQYTRRSRSGTQTRTRSRNATRTQTVTSNTYYILAATMPSNFWDSSNPSWEGEYSFTNWSNLSFGAATTSSYEAADLAFIYNGAGGYINAKFTGQPSWGWTGGDGSDYIYNINSGISSPTVPAVRVNVATNNTVALSARRSNANTTLYPIYLVTNPALENSSSASDNTTNFPSNYHIISETSSISNGAITYGTPTNGTITRTGSGPYTYTRTQTRSESNTQTKNITNQTIASAITFRQNAVTWNFTGSNTIIIGQKRIGPTSSSGKIFVKRNVNCNTL